MSNIKLSKRLSSSEIIFLLGIVFIGNIYVVYTRSAAISYAKDNVLQIARSVEACIPKEEILSLPQDPSDLQKQDFTRLRKALSQVIQVNDKARFAYLYIKRNDKCYFIADSEPESSPDYSPSGQEFYEADPTDMKPFEDGKALVTNPLTDRWGTWISAEVPVIDPKNKQVLAVLGMDYDAQSWKYDIGLKVLQSSLLVIIIFLLVLAYIIVRFKNKKLRKEIRLREEFENKLKESESDYRLLFELNPQSMLIYDLESMKIIAVNQAIVDKYGYTSDELTQLTINDLVSKEEYNRYQDDPITGQVSLSPNEVWNHRLKDGSSIQVEIHSNNFDFRHKNSRLITLVDVTESLNAKKALIKSERQMANLISNLPGIVYRCAFDRNYTMDFISDSCTRITGYSPEDFVTRKTVEFNDLILPEYRDQIWEKWQEAITEKKYFEYSYPIRTASGEIKWLWERGTAIFHENGKVMWLEGYLEDITLNKLAEEKLRQSEANLTLTIQESPVGIRIISEDGQTIYANPTFLHIFGFENLSEFNQVQATDWYTAQSYAEHLLREEKRIKGEPVESEYEISIVRQNKEIRHLQVFRSYILWNGERKSHVTYLDITERKLAEKELQKLSQAIEQNPASVVITDSNGNIEYVNPRFTEITGYQPEEAIGQNPRILKSGEMAPQIYAELWATITAGKVWKGELINRNKTGELYWANKSISPIIDSHGQITNYIAIGEEITEKKQREAELIKAKEKAEESDRLKSAFLANISHEIRTPMNGIMGFADLLKTPDLSPENQQEFIEVIEQSGQRMLDVINDLIDISIIEAGQINLKYAETNLNHLMKELYRFFRLQFERKNLEFSYSAPLSDQECLVKTDGGKLHQVLTNLIKNSLKFTEKGKVEFGYLINWPYFEFFVRDTGIGIPEEQKQIIFERFRQGTMTLTRRYEGAGLGLTISKATTEALGGKIWVESAPNEGTTFWIQIPFDSDKHTPQQAIPEDKKDLSAMNLQILVAENDENDRLLIQETLKEYAARLFFASNGQDAITLVQTHHDFNLALIDMHLPLTDIFETTQKIKELRPKLPVLGLGATSADQDKAFNCGCNNLITKPLTKESLIGFISKILLIAILFFQAACLNRSERQAAKALTGRITQAHGYVVPDDSLIAPQKIQAGIPEKIRIKQPKQALAYSNVLRAAEPKRISLAKPVVCTPGTGNFALPAIVPAIEKPFVCEQSEVMVAKDSYTRDINPANFSIFSNRQGLRHVQVRSMLQDRMGNIWFGTDDGATRFDGKYFSHLTTAQGLNSSLILSLLQDRKGNIWIGTFQGGVSRYDGRHLTNFTTAEGLSNNIVNCIFEDNAGNIWIGTGSGAVKYDGHQFTTYSVKNGLCHNDIRAINQDNQGKIWICSFGGGISVFDGKSFSNYSEKEGLIQNFFESLYKDHNGNIWLGSSAKGVLKYDGTCFTHYSEGEGMLGNEVRTILQDGSGNMWFGGRNGISKFDGKYFTQYAEQEGLSSKIIRSALFDRNGTLWLGTRNGGVCRYDGRLFTHLSSNEGLSNSRVMSIMQDNSGNVWLGTFGGGVTKLSARVVNGTEQKYYTYLTTSEGLPSDIIYSIIRDKDGNVWFGTDGGGICRYDGQTMMTYTTKEGLCSHIVRSVFQDKDGNLWIATYGSGVSRFDGKTFTNYTHKEGLSSDRVLCIFQDKTGKLWFGTNGKGLTCYDGKNFIHFTRKEGFPGLTVNCIFQDNIGNIWFGSAGEGLIKYNGTTFTQFTEKEGLGSNHVLSIIQDKHHHLWLGTRSGFSVLDPIYLTNGERTPESVRFKNYNYEDGFLGIGCNLGAICEDRSGTIWVGTNDRLTLFHPEGEPKDTVPPAPQITNVQLFNENIPWAKLIGKKDTTFTLQNGVKVGKIRFKSTSQWYNLPENPSLEYNDNYLSFNYICIAQNQSKRIKYKYTLEGADKNWTTTDRTEVSFGNLSPGSYIFKVKAMNSEGYWGKESCFPFTIRPPWWSTWWFRIVMLLSLVSLGYRFIKYREQNLEKSKLQLQSKVDEQTRELTIRNEALVRQKNEILEKNAAIEKKNEELQINNAEKDKFFSIIAHDVRGPLSSFIGMTELMLEEMPNLATAEMQNLITSMNVSAQNLYDLLENLLEWSQMKRGMRRFNPETFKMQKFMDDFLYSVFELAKNKSINLTFDIPENLEIHADKNMLATIIRNLLLNAIKFTERGGNVLLTARKNPNQEVEFEVKDSGIGMPPFILNNLFKINGKTNRAGTENEPSTGLGLLLCKEFVEKHGGEIRVESEQGKGSTFWFTLKIKPE